MISNELALDFEEIVDRQLDAYNRRDFETFASYYHPQISSFNLESSQILPEMTGNRFFEHYRKKFIDYPELHCKVTRRIVQGCFVVDSEEISFGENQKENELVIYQIEGQKIIRMWFS